MKTMFAIIGVATVCLATLASMGVGHFRLYYGPDNFTCTKARS